MAKKKPNPTRQISIDYKSTFDSPHGKKVLYHLAKACYVMSTTVPRTFDKDMMLFREGQRSVVLNIMKNVNMNLEQLEKLIREMEEKGVYNV